MRTYTWTFLLVIYSATSFAQLRCEKLVDTTSRVYFPCDSSLSMVVSKSKVTILFRRYSALSIWEEYNIISYQNDNQWHSYNLIHPDTTYYFYEVKAPRDSLLKLWNAVISNKLFSITKEYLNDPNCDAIIHDSHYYEFWIVSEDRYRRIRYYDPEYFESECESSFERKQIITCSNIFQDFARRYK